MLMHACEDTHVGHGWGYAQRLLPAKVTYGLSLTYPTPLGAKQALCCWGAL